MCKLIKVGVVIETQWITFWSRLWNLSTINHQTNYVGQNTNHDCDFAFHSIDRIKEFLTKSKYKFNGTRQFASMQKTLTIIYSIAFKEFISIKFTYAFEFTICAIISIFITERFVGCYVLMPFEMNWIVFRVKDNFEFFMDFETSVSWLSTKHK